MRLLRRTFSDAHVTAQFREIHVGCIGQQIATNLAEQVLNQGKVEVGQVSVVVYALVERERASPYLHRPGSVKGED
jgi:hypothetical protein